VVELASVKLIFLIEQVYEDIVFASAGISADNSSIDSF
jgi:hypothetical protein